MAHDKQLPENSNVMSGANRRLKESQAVVADWLTLYAQVWREEVTDELIFFYQETLKDLPPQILHRACLRVGKTSRFRPTPAEIRAAAEIEFELASKPKQLEGPKLSQEERDAAMEETREIREKLRISLGVN